MERFKQKIDENADSNRSKDLFYLVAFLLNQSLCKNMNNNKPSKRLNMNGYM